MEKRKFRQLKAIQNEWKKRLLEMNPNLKDGGGIYVFTRVDENGFRYAYIGQANQHHGIMTRLAEHMTGYNQHIDRSLKAHGLYSKANPRGWWVRSINAPDDKLDKLERYYIKKYADDGYQLRNKSLGGQNEGRNMIADTKPAKTYRDGLHQGRKSLAKELKHIIDTHLVISLKKETKISQKALEKFWMLLEEGDKDGK